VLADAWAPMFAVSMGIPRGQMLDMSVPEMVEHIDWWAETNRRSGDG